jgi:hypothetical protein
LILLKSDGSLFGILKISFCLKPEHNPDVVPGLRSLTEYEMRMSEEAGHSYVDRLAQLEEELLRDGHYVKSGSPFYSMSQFKRANPEAHALNQKALRMLEASRFLKNE